MDDLDTCPLCVETLDVTDKAVNYCQCGFRMCLWCWHRIMEDAAKENLEGKCPNCRTVYDEKKIKMQSMDPRLLQPEEPKKKSKPEKRKAPVASSKPSKKDLANVRVLQKNLVYAVGLAMEICNEDMLKDTKYFGQFGRVIKISVNRTGPHPGKAGSGSAYITYRRPADAERCIKAVDGVTWAGRTVRVCFGTTKYCNAFLKGVPCNNPDCLYLHDIADEDVSFTKDEMSGSGPAKFATMAAGPLAMPGGKKACAGAGPSLDESQEPEEVSQPIAITGGRSVAGGAAARLAMETRAAAAGVWGSPTLPSVLVSGNGTPVARGGWAAATVPAPQAAPPLPPPPVPVSESDWPELSSTAVGDKCEPSTSGNTAASKPLAAPGKPSAGSAAPLPSGGATMAEQIARAASGGLAGALGSAGGKGKRGEESGKKLTPISPVGKAKPVTKVPLTRLVQANATQSASGAAPPDAVHPGGGAVANEPGAQERLPAAPSVPQGKGSSRNGAAPADSGASPAPAAAAAPEEGPASTKASQRAGTLPAPAPVSPTSDVAQVSRPVAEATVVGELSCNEERAGQHTPTEQQQPVLSLPQLLQQVEAQSGLSFQQPAPDTLQPDSDAASRSSSAAGMRAPPPGFEGGVVRQGAPSFGQWLPPDGVEARPRKAPPPGFGGLAPPPGFDKPAPPGFPPGFETAAVPPRPKPAAYTAAAGGTGHPGVTVDELMKRVATGGLYGLQGNGTASVDSVSSGGSDLWAASDPQVPAPATRRSRSRFQFAQDSGVQPQVAVPQPAPAPAPAPARGASSLLASLLAGVPQQAPVVDGVTAIAQQQQQQQQRADLGMALLRQLQNGAARQQQQPQQQQMQLTAAAFEAAAVQGRYMDPAIMAAQPRAGYPGNHVAQHRLPPQPAAQPAALGAAQLGNAASLMHLLRANGAAPAAPPHGGAAGGPYGLSEYGVPQQLPPAAMAHYTRAQQNVAAANGMPVGYYDPSAAQLGGGMYRQHAPELTMQSMQQLQQQLESAQREARVWESRVLEAQERFHNISI